MKICKLYVGRFKLMWWCNGLWSIVKRVPVYFFVQFFLSFIFTVSFIITFLRFAIVSFIRFTFLCFITAFTNGRCTVLSYACLNILRWVPGLNWKKLQHTIILFSWNACIIGAQLQPEYRTLCNAIVFNETFFASNEWTKYECRNK